MFFLFFCKKHSGKVEANEYLLSGFRFSTPCSSAHSKHQNWHRLRAWKAKVTSGMFFFTTELVSCRGAFKFDLIFNMIFQENGALYELIDLDEAFHVKWCSRIQSSKRLRALVIHDMLDHVGSPPKKLKHPSVSLRFFSWNPVSPHCCPGLPTAGARYRHRLWAWHELKICDASGNLSFRKKASAILRFDKGLDLFTWGLS